MSLITLECAAFVLISTSFLIVYIYAVVTYVFSRSQKAEAELSPLVEIRSAIVSEPLVRGRSCTPPKISPKYISQQAKLYEWANQMSDVFTNGMTSEFSVKSAAERRHPVNRLTSNPQHRRSTASQFPTSMGSAFSFTESEALDRELDFDKVSEFLKFTRHASHKDLDELLHMYSTNSGVDVVQLIQDLSASHPSRDMDPFSMVKQDEITISEPRTVDVARQSQRRLSEFSDHGSNGEPKTVDFALSEFSEHVDAMGVHFREWLQTEITDITKKMDPQPPPLNSSGRQEDSDFSDSSLRCFIENRLHETMFKSEDSNECKQFLSCANDATDGNESESVQTTPTSISSSEEAGRQAFRILVDSDLAFAKHDDCELVFAKHDDCELVFSKRDDCEQVSFNSAELAACDRDGAELAAFDCDGTELAVFDCDGFDIEVSNQDDVGFLHFSDGQGNECIDLLSDDELHHMSGLDLVDTDCNQLCVSPSTLQIISPILLSQIENKTRMSYDDLFSFVNSVDSQEDSAGFDSDDCYSDSLDAKRECHSVEKDVEVECHSIEKENYAFPRGKSVIVKNRSDKGISESGSNSCEENTDGIDSSEDEKADCSEDEKADHSEDEKADCSEDEKADCSEDEKADCLEDEKADHSEDEKADCSEDEKAECWEDEKADCSEDEKADSEENSDGENEAGANSADTGTVDQPETSVKKAKPLMLVVEQVKSANSAIGARVRTNCGRTATVLVEAEDENERLGLLEFEDGSQEIWGTHMYFLVEDARFDEMDMSGISEPELTSTTESTFSDRSVNISREPSRERPRVSSQKTAVHEQILKLFETAQDPLTYEDSEEKRRIHGIVRKLVCNETFDFHDCLSSYTEEEFSDLSEGPPNLKDSEEILDFSNVEESSETFDDENLQTIIDDLSRDLSELSEGHEDQKSKCAFRFLCVTLFHEMHGNIGNLNKIQSKYPTISTTLKDLFETNQLTVDQLQEFFTLPQGQLDHKTLRGVLNAFHDDDEMSPFFAELKSFIDTALNNYRNGKNSIVDAKVIAFIQENFAAQELRAVVADILCLDDSRHI